MPNKDTSVHKPVLETLEMALAHLDKHGLSMPAIHLNSAIEALREHMETENNSSNDDVSDLT